MVEKPVLLELSREDYTFAPAQPYTIDRFRPEDAYAVARCYYAVYGNAYSVPVVYNPDALIEANTKGMLYPIVARTLNGDVVGHCALYAAPCCEFLF